MADERLCAARRGSPCLAGRLQRQLRRRDQARLQEVRDVLRSSRRSEYWWWVAFIFVALSLLGVAALWFGTATAPDGGSFGRGAYPFIIAMGVFLLAIIVPSIALAVRRLHDAGYSGLIYLLNLIPSIGGSIVAVLCILPTSPKACRYGPPDPGHHFARG